MDSRTQLQTRSDDASHGTGVDTLIKTASKGQSNIEFSLSTPDFGTMTFFWDQMPPVPSEYVRTREYEEKFHREGC